MVAAGARTHPLRCFAIRVLSSDSCRRRNVMLLGYRLVAVATLCSSDTVSWPVGADAQRANCEAPERAGADSAGSHVNDGDYIRNVMLVGYRLVAERTRLK